MRRREGHRIGLGRRGERAAAHWYVANGYEVLARNWRCRQGEIDLVCTRAQSLWSRSVQVLVVCEVKTRTSASYGHPLEAVTAAKQRRLRRLAAVFVQGQRAHFDQVRFDVVAIVAGELVVVEGAF